MNSPLSKAMVPAMLTFTLAATGCAVAAEEDETPSPAQEETGALSDALKVGGGSSGGGTSLWCACKLECDNTYSAPVLIKACKKQCDDNNKCRKGTVGGGGGVIIH